MRKLRQRVVLVLIILLASFSLFSGSENNVYVFCRERESPLKESDEVARVWEIQKIFRYIYDLYKNRVVFISTQKIVKLREDNGEFIDMEELLSVPGIDNRLLRKLKKHLFVESVEDCNC